MSCLIGLWKIFRPPVFFCQCFSSCDEKLRLILPLARKSLNQWKTGIFMQADKRILNYELQDHIWFALFFLGSLGPNLQKWKKFTFDSLKSLGILSSLEDFSNTILPHWIWKIIKSEDLYTDIKFNIDTHWYSQNHHLRILLKDDILAPGALIIRRIWGILSYKQTCLKRKNNVILSLRIILNTLQNLLSTSTVANKR